MNKFFCVGLIIYLLPGFVFLGYMLNGMPRGSHYFQTGVVGIFELLGILLLYIGIVFFTPPLLLVFRWYYLIPYFVIAYCCLFYFYRRKKKKRRTAGVQTDIQAFPHTLSHSL